MRLLLLGGLLLTLDPLRRTLRAQERGASIVGHVRDSTGAPIAGVEVGVSGAAVRVRSDGAGAFRLVGLLPGPATLIARRLGYEEHSTQLRLGDGQASTVDIILVPTAARVEGVEVKAPRTASDSRLAGFRARSKTNLGYYVTRERIDRANSTFLSDMLREIPGIRIGPMRNQGRSIRLRGATCAPLVFIDGSPASAGEFDVDIVDLQSVEGIEVYSGSASIPPEFAGPRDMDRCGVIAIWSRPAGPPGRKSPQNEGEGVGPRAAASLGDAQLAKRRK
ncbi:MAG TPA: TonB-dependent receptor [Gemmatimonadaceae bacterium]